MTETVTKIELPPYQPPTAEELARRSQLAEKIRRLREEIGPIGRSVTDLIRRDRESH